jgi:predicted PurR-regulated permease PerM
MTLFVMIVATLYFGREVLVPVTLALLLAFILAPVVELLRRVHLGRVPSVLLGVILALGVVVAIGGVIGSQIAGLTRELPQYAGTVERKVSTIKDYTVGRLSHLTDRIGAHGGSAASSPELLSDNPAAARCRRSSLDRLWSWRGAISPQCSRLWQPSVLYLSSRSLHFSSGRISETA